MKKILFLIPNLAHGGAEKVLVNLVNNLDKTKFDVTVMTLFDVGVNKKNLNNDVHYKTCYKKQFHGNSHYFKLYSPQTLYKRFIKDSYDILVSYLEGPTARIISGCDDEKVKKVAWIHTQHYNLKNLSKSFRNEKEALSCYNKFDAVVGVSKDVIDDFCSIVHGDFKALVKYNTNETEKITLLSNEEFDDIKFSSDCVNIISVGKLTEVKGFKRLLEAHHRLLNDGIKNNVYIFGIGEQENELKGLISQYSLENTFFLPGYRENPYKYIKSCDIYACSSYREGFSTSVTEALILGVPTVTTLCSGMTELLGDSEYGLVSENTDEAFYNALKNMVSDEKLRLSYKSKALERGKLFSKEKTVSAVEEMFNSDL